MRKPALVTMETSTRHSKQRGFDAVTTSSYGHGVTLTVRRNGVTTSICLEACVFDRMVKARDTVRAEPKKAWHCENLEALN